MLYPLTDHGMYNDAVFVDADDELVKQRRRRVVRSAETGQRFPAQIFVSASTKTAAETFFLATAGGRQRTSWTGATNQRRKGQEAGREDDPSRPGQIGEMEREKGKRREMEGEKGKRGEREMGRRKN